MCMICMKVFYDFYFHLLFILILFCIEVFLIYLFVD